MLQHTEVAFSSEAVKKIEEQSHAWKHLCNLKANRIGRATLLRSLWGPRSDPIPARDAANAEQNSAGASPWAETNYCRTIVLNRFGKLAGSNERFHPFEKCLLTSVHCPSAERLGQPFYTFYLPSLALPLFRSFTA